MGYAFTEDTSVADVIVITTCAIREHAELRVLGNVGALTHTKRRKPNQVKMCIRDRGCVKIMNISECMTFPLPERFLKCLKGSIDLCLLHNWF